MVGLHARRGIGTIRRRRPAIRSRGTQVDSVAGRGGCHKMIPRCLCGRDRTDGHDSDLGVDRLIGCDDMPDVGVNVHGGFGDGQRNGAIRLQMKNANGRQ